MRTNMLLSATATKPNGCGHGCCYNEGFNPSDARTVLQARRRGRRREKRQWQNDVRTELA